jgi:hypothetical protein
MFSPISANKRCNEGSFEVFEIKLVKLLRLLDLEGEVKSMFKDGLLDMGHARALLTLNGL